MKVEVTFYDKKLPVGFRHQVEEICRYLLEQEQLSGGEVNVVFCSDAYIARLNRKYRRTKGPTDVLSFNFVEAHQLPRLRESGQEVCLGEVYISLDRAGEQSLKRGGSLLQEVRRLTAHGMFHLIGFDHRSRKEELRMKLNERKLLREVQRRQKKGGGKTYEYERPGKEL